MGVSRGLGRADYADESVFTRERERIFGASWLPACRVDELARPGDYVTASLAGDPIIITRTRSGEITALANVCRHRNMRLVDGRGNVAAFRCPYHHWTYRADGSLVAAPETAAIAEFDADQFCLPRLLVEEWHGFVMVNADPDAAPFANSVTGLATALDGKPLADMVRTGSITWDQPWNWKLTIENYSESYHHRAVHTDTLQPLFPGERSRPVTGGDEPWMYLEHEIAVEDVEPLLVIAVYPALLITFVGDDVMTWLRLDVHGPRHSTLATDIYMTPERAADPEFAEFELEAVRAVNAQDESPNRGVDAGLASRWAVRAWYHPLEAGVAHFNDWYRDKMR